jgi:hypothetical protein
MVLKAQQRERARSRAAGSAGANVFCMARSRKIEVYAGHTAEESVAQTFTFA